MSLFKDVKNSIYNPEFYSELIDRPLSYSLKYFFSLICLISIAVSAYFTIIASPQLMTFAKESRNSIVSKFPSELEVTIKKGEVSTNVKEKEPYLVSMPQMPRLQQSSMPTNNQAFQNIVVIDTVNQFSLEKFYEYHTAFLVTKNDIIYSDKDKITITSLAKSPDLVINKTSTESFFKKLDPLVKFIPLLLAIFVFSISFFIGSAYLFYFLYFALLVWLVVRINKIHTGYMGAYKITLHAATLSILVDILMKLFFSKYNLSYVFDVVILIVVIANLYGVKKLTLNK
ncbi:MAG: DUF1189 family protein [Candidatus Paceibacterota bacterium]